MHIQYDPAISAIVSHTHPLSHFIWSLYPMTIAMILNIWQLLLVLAIRGMIGMIYLVWDDVLIVTWVFIADLIIWLIVTYVGSLLGFADEVPETSWFWWCFEPLPLDQQLPEQLPLYRERNISNTANMRNITHIAGTTQQPSISKSSSSQKPPTKQLRAPPLEITTVLCVVYNMIIYKASNFSPEHTIVNRDYSAICIKVCVWILAILEGRVVCILLGEGLRGLRGLRRLSNKYRNGKTVTGSIAETQEERNSREEVVMIG